MNNRFKFRVFISDKENSKNSLTRMFKVHSLHTGTNKVIITSSHGNYSIKLENNVLMQCTGLRDKNGRLIYEGDIVRFKDCNDILVINYQEEMACFAPQFYCNGEYGDRLWFDDYDSSECQFHKSNNFEIIGNIYENKELLESEG